ncbi:heterokaryon incompatibility protein [Paraphaeosphaeria sporulosa]
MTKSNADPFSYAAVSWKSGVPSSDPCIRVLELAPGVDSMNKNPSQSPLHCSLFWTPLQSPAAVPFKALSYTWGTGGFTSTLCINGRGFKITSSLEQALRHLQHPSEYVTLWVDQICINQQDNKEKSKQVALMGAIYQAAEETLVWLGPTESNSTLFMRVWREVGEDAEGFGMMDYYTTDLFPILTRITNNIDPDDPQTIEFNAIRHRATSRFTLEFLKAMVEWHKRPWFTRVWVVQEFSLTSKATFVCGHQRISAEQALLARQIFDHCTRNMLEKVHDVDRPALLNAFSALRNNPTQAFFATRQQKKKFVAENNAGTTLYRLLCNLHVDNKLQATEPCDFIWGILGLAVDAKQLQIRPDYEMKDRIELIYTETAKAIIKKDGLDLIALSQFPKVIMNLPSWVPDWTANPRQSFAAPLDDCVNQFTASKDSPFRLLSATDVGILGLTGFYVDRIERLGAEWHIEITEVEHTSYQEKWLALLTEVEYLCWRSDIMNHDIYPSNARRAEAKWRVPIGDIQYTEVFDPTRAEPSYVQAYKDCMFELDFLKHGGSMGSDDFHRQQRAYYESTTRNRGGRYRVSMQGVRNKRPFLSNLGYVGMGPLHMRPGDHIVVFKGAKIPYIVRHLEDGKYSLVGECYCDGIMDGEIVERRHEEDFYLL